jgi:hypothetical protein
MLAKIDEGMILITAGTNAAYYRLSLSVAHAIIFTVASGSGQFLHVVGFGPTPLFV